MFDDRNYLILLITELYKVDFSQVLETSIDTCITSIDGTKTIIKWEGPVIPDFVNNIISKEGPYTFDKIQNIIITSEWYQPINISYPS